MVGEEAFTQNSDQGFCKTWAAPFWTATFQAGCLSVATLPYKASQEVLLYIHKISTIKVWMLHVFCIIPQWMLGRKAIYCQKLSLIEVIWIRYLCLSGTGFREDTESLWYYIVLLIYRFTADTQNVPLLVHFTVLLDTKIGRIQQETDRSWLLYLTNWPPTDTLSEHSYDSVKYEETVI